MKNKLMFFVLAALLAVLPSAYAGAAPAVRPWQAVAASAAPEVISLPGIAFMPATSSTNWSYYGQGCITSTTSATTFHAPLYLKDGSVITGFSVGYFNTGALGAANLTALMFSYYPTLASTYFNLTLDATTGQHVSTSSATSLTVNNSTNSWMVNWTTPASGSQTLCFVKVTYIPPSIFGIALPNIQK
jgi:hypothetical protein